MPDHALPSSVTVLAALNFLDPAVKAPRRYIATPPPGEPVDNARSVTHRVAVRNGRGFEHHYTLDNSGFALIHAPTEARDLYDDAEILVTYRPEVERLIRRATGASRVVAFDHTIRNARRAEADAALRSPAKRIHNDYTPRSAEQRVRDILPDEADWLLSYRFAVVNLWRSIAPVLESPLALADGHSVEETDLVPTRLIYPDRIGETHAVLFNPAHRWTYFPHMQPEEALLIKCHDSATDGRVRLSIHGAFDDPTSPADAPPRESIEVRTLVFWAPEHPADA